eukprot:TRINITY_DN358_c0_g1_i1.p1 TRINITY_DN358_c0_g1~~TRINITY_DN358_c0_g1_i1.p1  ORF type:complete len:156 (-),score=15.77 TRINITY_DN358_c0_g1_i1:164-562(-)
MAYQYNGNVLVELVSHLEDHQMFNSRRIREAMLFVQRGDFLPPNYQDFAYQDKPLKISELGFNVSAPHMYAHCLESLEIQPGNTVLDVGSGCGHFTGIAGFLAGEVDLFLLRYILNRHRKDLSSVLMSTLVL